MVASLLALLRAPRPALYAALFGVAFALAGVGLGGLGWLYGPPEGDLTRIASLSERRYGWTGEALGWPEIPAAPAPGADVLVLGDSFSIPRPHGADWINALRATTGWRVAFRRYRDAEDALAILNEPALAADPPRVVIFQTVERAAAQRFAAIADRLGCAGPVASPGPAPLTRPDPAPAPERPSFRRRTAFDDPDELFSRGALVAWRLIQPYPLVARLPLARDDLFSSAEPATLLVLRADLEARRTSVAAEAVRCGAAAMAARIEALGSWPTLMVAPDKTTAYAPLVAAGLPERRLDVEALAARATSAHVIRLTALLQDAAAQGPRDLYWPDDSHWGAAGNALVANTMAKRLKSAPDDGI